MNRIFIAGAVALSLSFGAVTAASAAEPVPTVVKIEKPAAGTPVLVVLPTVELGLLTIGGAVEPKPEWNQNSQKFLNASFVKTLENKKYKTSGVDLATYENPEALQILKLNDAVMTSIQTNMWVKLPTKTTFDWTLGDGATSLVPATADPAEPPAYALFVTARGSYQSGGRAAMNVAAAMLGGPIMTGSQIMTGSLVDLKTGRIVWYQLMAVPSGTDIRTAEGAASATAKLFEKLPL